MTYVEIFRIIESCNGLHISTNLKLLNDSDSMLKLNDIIIYTNSISLYGKYEKTLQFCLDKDVEIRDQKLKELGI